MKNTLCIFILLLIAFYLTGCALMLGKETHSIPIMSNPVEASVLIHDENGIEIFNGKTPALLNLSKSDGNYWGGKTYLATISKPGFKTQIYPILTVPNNYFLLGNIMTIYIGFFIDPFSGHMYNFSPEIIVATLEK